MHEHVRQVNWNDRDRPLLISADYNCERRLLFPVGGGAKHSDEVVDRVIGERGELLGSVGSRGNGAHRGEGVFFGARGLREIRERNRKGRVLIGYGMQNPPKHSVT